MRGDAELTSPRLSLAVAIVVLSSLPQAAWANSFHFTVTADPRQYDTLYGKVLDAMQAKVGGQGAFQVSPGDIDPPANLRAQIDSHFGSGALWYPLVGNHEIDTPDDTADMTWLRNEYANGNGVRTPLKDFTNQNGPAGCVETMFSWDYGNAHFVSVNEYWNGGAGAGSDAATAGRTNLAIRDWLAADLAASNQPFVFVFGHEPAFPLNRHVGDSLDKYVDDRDAFWDLLEGEGVSVFICGHTHVYSTYQQAGGGVWQIDVGNAGNNTYGDGLTFLDITVDDLSVTYSVWRDVGGTGNAFALAESWTIGVAAERAPYVVPEPLTLVLCAMSFSSLGLYIRRRGRT